MTAVGPGPLPSPRFCLTEVEIFQDLAAEEMAAIAERAPMRTVPAGTVVYDPLQPRRVLFIVKVGRIRVYRVSSDGRCLTLAILGPGSVFGEMPEMGQQMGDGYAEAIEPTVLCVMSSEDVRTMLLADPRIAARVTAALGLRLADVEQRLADTVLKSAPQRVAAALVMLSAPAAPRRGLPRRGVEIRLTHEQLAELVGTTRETTTKVLGELREGGWLTLRRGRIVVLDREGLRHVGEG